MAKKSGGAGFGFFINGKPASLLEIAEASGDEITWKSYKFIKEAIKNNESTGWYAKVEEEEEILACFGSLLGTASVPSIEY